MSVAPSVIVKPVCAECGWRILPPDTGWHLRDAGGRITSEICSECYFGTRTYGPRGGKVNG